MDKRELIYKLSEIDERTDNQLLKEAISIFILELLNGISANAQKMLIDFQSSLSQRKQKYSNLKEIKKNAQIIIDLEELIKMAEDERIKLVLVALISSIVFKEIEEFKNILSSSSSQLSLYLPEAGKTLH